MSKIGRNDPCPCGSGKKYKACCDGNPFAMPTQRAPSIPIPERIRLAWQHFQFRQIIEAEQMAHAVLEMQPRNVDALYLCSVVCLERSDYARAISLLHKAIAINPTQPELHLSLGSAHAAAGRREEALQSFRKSVQLNPQFAAGHNRLGAFLQEQGSVEEAIECFQRAVKCEPGFAMALCNLGTAYKQLGKDALAISAFENALQADPNFVGALTNLGIVLHGTGETEKAAQMYERALALDPLHAQTHIALGNLRKTQERFDAALAHFEQALRSEPDNVDIRFQIDSIKNADVERAPLEYVRNLFDSFATSFDHKLVDVLGYSAPQLLAKEIRDISGGKNGWRVIDLGCGTGLMGIEIKPIAARLVGVDVSPGMLAMAHARGIYDELIEDDLVRYMEGVATGNFDLICAADVFIYIGNLVPLFSAAAAILPAGGLFAFSLEANQVNEQPFRLGASSRYAHSKTWIEKLSGEAGLLVERFSECTLRQENNAAVAGYLFVLRKS